MGTSRRKRQTGQAKFDRMLKKRVKDEHSREDAVTWLAEQARMTVGYVSKMLNHKVPRVGSEGVDYRAWAILKKFLTKEEIAILEKVPPCN